MPLRKQSPDNIKKKDALTIGLLVNSAEDKYENAILHGAHDVLQSVQANLICFTSGALRSFHGFESKRNILYNLVNHQVVDGLIICGTLAHNTNIQEIGMLCARYQPIPMVSIAMLLDDIPGILVDSLSAMRANMEHLLMTHNYSKLAFIRGPQEQREADERYQAYLDALAQYDIPFDPRLVAHGDYTRASGQAAMSELLFADVNIQAVVCANDSMALGAMDVLGNRGLRIPADIAVTGFDDTEDGRYTQTPLTTICQSVRAQGQMAARLLLAQIAGEKVPAKNPVPGKLVIRQSCGCPAVHQQNILQSSKPRANPDNDLTSRRASILQAMALAANPLPPGDVPVWTSKLFDALLSETQGQKEGAFLSVWVSVLQHSPISIDEQVWEEVLLVLREQTMIELTNAGILWNQAENFITEMKAARQAQLRVLSEQRALALREIGETMVTTFNMDSLLSVIAQDLPSMGVQACYLSLYENPKKPASWARLILAYDQNGRKSLPPDGKRFASTRLVANNSLRKYQAGCLVVEALYSRKNQLGFVVLALPPDITSICGALRGQLSSAIQGILLLQERQKAEAQLQLHQNELENMVSARTIQLLEANLQLEQEIFERRKAEAEIRALNTSLEQRVQERTLQLEAANKELEAFTYSVSHDLRAPLRGIAGFTRMLLDEHSEQLDDSGKMLFERIVVSTKQMNTLINDLLGFSKLGQKPLNKQAISGIQMENLAKEIMEELWAQSPERKLNFEVEPMPGCKADFALVKQVLVNLLSNAYKYSRNRETAHIRFGYSDNTYFVSDNGVGFDMKYANRLFGVFQRLHRNDDFEGTGVGLATVHRIVTRHGGKIWAVSVPDKGAIFYFTLAKQDNES
jgi:DNA-binding LacI/PurR family transcriptional regulator/signal transduction histidine kinase